MILPTGAGRLVSGCMSKRETAHHLTDFLPYQLSVASNAVSTRIAEQYRRRFALKTTEWRVMAVLGDSGPLTQRDLGQLTLMDKVPVNRACRKLVDRGFAQRRPNSRDGRSHLLELTAEGRAIHTQIMPLALAIEQEIFAGLSEADRDALHRLLTRIRHAAGEFDADSLSE